ncbi:hypothetical protein BDV12DRAFT_173542 [Aspergillus spectabilis]
MNKTHIRLLESYESLRREALCLQDQVHLQGQSETWNKSQVVLLQFPEDAVTRAGINSPQRLNLGYSSSSWIPRLVCC